MGFFDKLFRKPHPSDAWIPSESFPLVLDLSRHRVGNAALGRPIEWLSTLGPPEDPKMVHEDRYCYFSKGLEVDVDDGLVSGIVVMWQVEGSDPFEPFTGRVMYRDRELLLNHGYTEDDFVSTVGEPFHRDGDADEIILFYEPAPDAELQVEFTLMKSFKAIIMTSEPLLSSESQREAYRVTRAWPPSYGQR